MSGSKLEFTPIGRRRGEGAPLHSSPSRHRMALNTEKINNSHAESTFDDTTDHEDTLQSLEFQKVPEKSAQNNQGVTNGGLFGNMFKPRLELVNDGANSIQELQKDNRALQAENYNLKIEVATLTKFLKQTPEENRNLAYENVELKQQLMKALNELEGREAVVSLDLVSQNSMRSLYKEIIEEREHEIHQLQLKVSELTHNAKEAVVSGELLDKLEFLQSENQSLRRKLDDATNNDLDFAAIQEENNNLKSRLFGLEHEVSLLPQDASGQIERLNDELRLSERKIKSLEEDLDGAEHERDSLKSSVDRARADLSALTLELESLRRERDDLMFQSRNTSDVDSRLERARQESQDLKSSLRRLEAQSRNDVIDKESEINALNTKVKSLSRELLDKEKDHIELQNQVRSLMEERNRAFDNQGTLKHYQSQIETLRNKEMSLEEKNRELKSEIAKLNDELFSLSSESSHASKLKDQIRELEDKLDFYEKEYGLLQDAMENAETEAETLKAKQRRSESEVSDLNLEIEKLTSKLRRTELSESQKYNESALFELENSLKKREDVEKQRLELQIDALNLQVRKLELELRRANTSEPAIGEDYQKYLKERSKLQMELDDKDLQLEEQKRKFSKLENMIKDKDSLVEALESRIRDLNRENRSNILYEDSSKSDIHKLRTDYEFQLRTLQHENSRLQSDLESQIRYYQTKLDVFMERERYDPANNPSSSMVALLESQLEELRRQNKELSDKVTASQMFKAGDLENLLSEYRGKLQELQTKYNRALDEKLSLQESVDTLEMDMKILRSEKNRLESRTKNLNQELNRTSKHCTKLANKLYEIDLNDSKQAMKSEDDGLRAKRMNLQLQAQIDQLNAKLAASKFPTPSRGSSRSASETRLLRNELQYYKAKLFELNVRANDLALMNSFVMSSIKNSNQMIKNDIVKLSQVGIYPDYAEMNRKRGGSKVTLKVLATFVLSMVRLKNRLQKAEERRGKMLTLRSEIDRDKITLLAE